MSIFRRLREAIRRGPSGVLLPAWREVTGETPPVTFSEITTVYLAEYAAKAAVDFWADQAVGAGFYTSCGSTAEYPQAQDAKDVVDDFCEVVNLDGLLHQGAREVVGAGNSFWEKRVPRKLEDLVILPLTSIEKILRTQAGEIRGYKQVATYGGKTLAPETIIHFRWNPVNGEAFGTGILRVLLESLAFNGEVREGLVEYKARIEKIIPDVFEKHAGPDTLWVFEGISDAKLADYQRIIKARPKAGAAFVYNKPADVKAVSIDPRTAFQPYIDHVINQYYLGLQTPLPKLFTTPGFTEASARAAVEMAEAKVVALQRFLKRIVEREIFTPVIEQAGLDPVKAGCRLNWGTPETLDMKTLVGILPQLTDVWKSGGITTEEFRTILRETLLLKQVAEAPKLPTPIEKKGN